MNMQHLNSFIQVVRYQSFSKASFALYISQPALSQQIKKLETEIGFELFDHRNKNAICLTTAGEMFYKYAISAVEEYKTTIKSCLQAAGKIVTVNFGSDYRDFPQIKPRLFDLFKEKYPQYDLKVKLANWASLMTLLETEKLDIVYSSEPLTMPKGFTFSQLGEVSLAITGLKENPAFKAEKVHLDDLKGKKLSLPTDEIGRAIAETNKRIREQYEDIIFVDSYTDVSIHNISDPEVLYLTIETPDNIFPDLETRPLISEYCCPMGMIARKGYKEIVEKLIQINQELPA